MKVRTLGVRDLDEVEQLYADVFGAVLNRRLVIGLVANGAHLLGAHDDSALVGYGLSFTGHDADGVYAYSQTVGVATHARGRGVGRAIKQAQRAAARRDGLHRMRWVFDPAAIRNAQFNTDVLGGRIIALHKDFYGDGADRFLVEWALDEPPHPADWDAPLLAAGETRELGAGVAVGAPGDYASLLGRGLVGVSCRRTGDDSATYLFAPR